MTIKAPIIIRISMLIPQEEFISLSLMIITFLMIGERCVIQFTSQRIREKIGVKLRYGTKQVIPMQQLSVRAAQIILQLMKIQVKCQ